MPLTPILQQRLPELPDGAIAVACSGGLDSSVLLHALAHVPAARARGLRAIHVDHQLHADSGRWSEHCERFAQALDVPFSTHRVGVEPSGNGLEDAARAARFALFGEQLGHGEILALAQHRDDQAETILLKLLRGAGPEGLGGMRGVREFGQGWLWRPLLDVPRAVLREYAQAHALRWIDDPSNADTSLRRNFVRNEILPRLAERWPDASAALAHSATWARAAADFIEDQARIALAKLQGLDSATLRWNGWLELPDALRDPVLRLWLRELGFDEPAHFHVGELERQLRAAEDRMPCIAFAQTELRRYRDLLYAIHPQPPIPEHWETPWDGAPLELPDGSRLMLEPGDARTTLHVRYRRGGEAIKPAGDAHTRELRTLLQESGIPPWQRERIPLIYAGDELLAVGDLFLSDAGARWCAKHETRFACVDSMRGLR
jgi:tRNA(Ile)-lysidine synthase